MGPTAAAGDDTAVGVEGRAAAPTQGAGVVAAARPSHIPGGEDRRHALLATSLASLDLGFQPAPAAAPSVWAADPWATQVR